ncbi:hypothetical protein [Desulfovibrio sp. JC022]|uniref:hypothetical protein n=1 Tax=Desulfovibrio sp. JC022 TaxID=2593642 RepID=UPI0013D3A24C|nr:hypothetical protein [Desulfovibrio sp. JC022]NDV22209.1 hypothetical protein [Desulfovibrio sp. JC022]
MPKVIAEASEYLPEICMVKRTPKTLYTFKGERMTVEAIYRKIKKKSRSSKSSRKCCCHDEQW